MNNNIDSETYKKSSIGFLLIGLLLLILFLKNVYLGYKSDFWLETTAEVIRSKLSVSQDDGSDSYNIVVNYKYSVEGKVYENNRINFGYRNMRDGGKAKNIIYKYRTGVIVPVYYNPKDPNQSVLEKGYSLNFFILFFILICLLSSFILRKKYLKSK